MIFINIFIFICFYSSAGSIQIFSGDRRGSGQVSSVSSWEEEKKNRAARVSLPSLLSSFCSLSLFPACPSPPATPAAPATPPSSRMRALLCVCPHQLIVALICSATPPRAFLEVAPDRPPASQREKRPPTHSSVPAGQLSSSAQHSRS